jgi:hypothetical protein
MSNEDDLNALRTIAAADAAATDRQLQQDLAALHRSARSRLEALRPQLATDDATFDSMVRAVEEATANNVSIAEFTNRLKTLGKNVLTVARTASSLLPT